MSGPIRTDEIEKFLTSVRGFVTHQSAAPQRRRVKSELLVLTPANRVDDEDAADGAPETPAEYTRFAPEVESNVHHLETAKQPERPSLEATIAELEAAVTEQPDDWEPDEGENFAQEAWAASAFQTPEIDSPVEPEAAPEPTVAAAESVEAAPVPVAETTTNPDMASQIAKEVESAFGVRDTARNVLQEMDNDTLRDMVTDIIREELAGELGEKVTRNVRKLVRREINRALMARGLD